MASRNTKDNSQATPELLMLGYLCINWTSLHCLNYMDLLTRIAMILPDNVAIRRSLNS